MSWRIIASLLALVGLGNMLSATLARAEFEFVGCTDDQREVILYAYGLAFGRAKAAEDHVGPTAAYKRWFGPWTEERGDVVLRQISDIIAASLVGTPKFTCLPHTAVLCRGGKRLAYIVRQTSYDISLCPAFWSIEKRLGYDMTSVILHEIAHFEIGAGGVTFDHCQGFGGTKACEDLARERPDLAVENADNYRLFIEDGMPSNRELWDLSPPPGFN